MGEVARKNLVHRKLPISVYHQGMGGTATNGTLDHYYEAIRDTIWIEWKWTNSLKPRLIPDLRSLQKEWARRAYGNGVQVAVICGFPGGNFIFPSLTWESRKVTDAEYCMTNKETAVWITDQVT